VEGTIDGDAGLERLAIVRTNLHLQDHCPDLSLLAFFQARSLGPTIKAITTRGAQPTRKYIATRKALATGSDKSASTKKILASRNPRKAQQILSSPSKRNRESHRVLR
jgi:hypothetical protein